MKANAPEKIYIQPDAQDGWFMVNNLNNTLVEYTRTDAFIDKACEWIKILMVASGNYDAYDIQENLKDFKQAMNKE